MVCGKKVLVLPQSPDGARPPHIMIACTTQYKVGIGQGQELVDRGTANRTFLSENSVIRTPPATLIGAFSPGFSNLPARCRQEAGPCQVIAKTAKLWGT